MLVIKDSASTSGESTSASQISEFLVCCYGGKNKVEINSFTPDITHLAISFFEDSTYVSVHAGASTNIPALFLRLSSSLLFRQYYSLKQFMTTERVRPCSWPKNNKSHKVQEGMGR